MKHNILIVIGSLDLGGTEKHLLQVLPQLNSDNLRFSIFTLTKPGILAAKMASYNIKIISPHTEDRWSKATAIKKIHMLIYSTYKLYRLLRNKQFDIVHLFLPASYILGGICALFARVPCIIMSRRSLNYYQKQYPGFRVLEKVLHKYMTLVTANAKAVALELEQEGVSKNKIKLIYNGIDIKPFYITNCQKKMHIREQLNIPCTSLVFIIVANLRPYKGHIDLLQALHMVKDKLPQPWSLLCVGADPIGWKSQLLKQVSRLELTNIRFLGSRQDIANLLAASDIALLCSHEEGFSNSILEYMAAGLPVIATNVGGNSEAVIHGTTGYIVQPKNPDELSKCILELSINKELCLKMGNQACERIKKHFLLDQCVGRYQEMYNIFTVKNI